MRSESAAPNKKLLLLLLLLMLGNLMCPTCKLSDFDRFYRFWNQPKESIDVSSQRLWICRIRP